MSDGIDDPREPVDWPELADSRIGSGKPLLLIHSLGGSRVMWEPVLDLLAGEHEVIAVDLPGFGDSPRLPSAMEPSPRNLARAALAHCERRFAGESVHLAGISLGSFVSIEAARLGRAKSVTALCAAGFWEQPLGRARTWARWMARAAWPYLRRSLRSEQGRARALGRVMCHPERVTYEQAARMVSSYAHSPAFPRANALMRGSVIGRLDPDVPHTLAWAEHDRLVRNQPVAEKRVGRLVRQVVMPGVGHVPTWDDPLLVARTIGETTASAATEFTAA